MLKISARAVLLLVLTIGFTSCSIFEAYNSEDVSFFVQSDVKANVAIMFYDPFQEEGDYEIFKNVEKINGIFLSKGDPARSVDQWVNSLNDGANLLRVDTMNPYNDDAKKSFHVSRTPFLVILEDGNVVFEEALRDGTYNHVRDVLDKSNSASNNNFGSQNFGSGSNSFSNLDSTLQRYGQNAKPQSNNQNGNSPQYDPVDRAEESLEGANKKITKNKQTVENSLKELQDQRKRVQAYQEVESARQKAEKAKQDAEVAKKNYEAAQKELNQHINDLNKEEGERQKSNNSKKAQSYTNQSTRSHSSTPPRIYGGVDAHASASTSTSHGSYPSVSANANTQSTVYGSTGNDNFASSRTWNGYKASH
ncbi:unnamed protein product [Moneuplotes crassus]|uniref:Uncharacterized protein n=1 Tax=Euplotes crassus TaxID=5936 RepID=A0AAD2CWZ2_EUPCR|nr:unnamed protein product [Moneuplotes crassus]